MALDSIDYRAELEAFDWSGATWTDDKLIARSPFRIGDSTPSFYVWLDGENAGLWGDSGAAEESEYKRGGFVKLLAYLRGEDEAETRAYLGLDDEVEDDTPRIRKLNLARFKRSISGAQRKAKIVLDRAILAKLRYRHPYLGRRGISEAAQRLFSVGYDRATRAISMPWFHADGSLAAIKYRSVTHKAFWYHAGGAPVYDLIYGIDNVYKYGWREVFLCESETDAMAAVTAGCNAIAAGGASFKGARRDLIVKSSIECVYIAADNDEAGNKFAEEVIAQLAGHVKLFRVRFGEDEKDVAEALNESGVERVRALRDAAEPVRSRILSKEKYYFSKKGL